MGQLRVKRVGQFALKYLGHFLLKQVGQLTVKWVGQYGLKYSPCPSGYRLPTEAEWEAEIQSWSSYNATGAFASVLKLPIAGDRSFGSLYSVGINGIYWSSTVDEISAGGIGFDSVFDARVYSYGRAFGHSVRCIKD